MTDHACELQNLRKTYKVGFLGRPVVACRDVSLTVKPGETFGLVGPNGAGKSTTIKMMLGFVRPDGGTGRILGRPLGDKEARRRIGYLPELPIFPRYLTAREVMDFHGALAGVPSSGWAKKRDATLERVGLVRAAGERLQNYSKGMLQRCALAVALVGEPDLLVLDEPMSGLDPLGRHDVRSIIREQSALGRTVIFSSHVLSDVTALCSSVAIVSQGSVFRSGSLAEVTGGSTAGVEVQLAGGTPESRALLEPLGTVRVMGDVVTWELASPDRVNDALALALQHGWSVRSVAPRSSALEELVLQANRTANSEGRISP